MPSNALFGGIPMPRARLEFGIRPQEIKNINFPGADGTFVMVFGDRPRTITVKGRLVDQTIAQIGNFPDKFPENFTGNLTHNGTTFLNCIARSARVFNMFQTADAANAFTAEYEIQFEELLGIDKKL